MPQIVQIQSAAFSLLAVAQGTDVSTVLLSYTMPPDAQSPLNATDALNPSNYTITGPSLTSVAVVTPLSSYMFSLTLTAPLVSGSYVISVANVESNGSALGAPTSLLFQAVAGTPKEPVNQGADNDLTENVLRRWLPPQYRYKTAWEALIAAIESGDRFVRENAYNAFDQLFLSSAIRPYLFQRAADFGITYPGQVGMSDDLFRQLAIKTTAKKLVHQALLEILEVFYGENATRANVVSGLKEPFVLRTGDSIDFSFDDRNDVTVTFNAADFSNISVATASEVAAVMTRAFRAAGVSAYASARAQDEGTAIAVYSGALGLLGSVRVTGGMAQNAIQFPTRIPLFVSPMPTPAPTWTSLRTSQDEFRFTWTRDYTPGFLKDVQVGDYVLLDFVNASTLRGSYEVTDVHIDANISTGSPNGLTWFSIKPTLAFPYSYGNGVNITQNNVNEIIFYRIVRQTVAQAINPSFIAQYGQTGVDVILPATTQAVDRGPTNAAYLHVADQVGGGIAEGGIAYVSGSVGIPDISVELASTPQTVLSTGGGAFIFYNVAAGDHTVTPTPATLSIAPLSFSIAAGATQQMVATLHTATTTSTVTNSCVWGSTDTNVFTVNASTGLVTGVGAGTANVTCSYLGTWVETTMTVTVYDSPVSGVNFTRASILSPQAAGTVTAAPVATIIPQDVNSVAHVGVNAGAIVSYAGPAWTPGAGGAPNLTALTNVFGNFGGIEKQGMTGFTATKNIYLPPNNVVDSLYQLDNWVMVWVIGNLPTQVLGNWTPGPPIWFSLGDYQGNSEPGMVAYASNVAIPGASAMATFPKPFYTTHGMAAGNPQSRGSTNIWTTNGTSTGVAILARAGNNLIIKIKSRTLDPAVNSQSLIYNKVGTITHPTILGAFHDVGVHQAFTNGVIYEFRMTQQATPPTTTEVDNLAWAITSG